MGFTKEEAERRVGLTMYAITGHGIEEHYICDMEEQKGKWRGSFLVDSRTNGKQFGKYSLLFFDRDPAVTRLIDSLQHSIRFTEMEIEDIRRQKDSYQARLEALYLEVNSAV